MSWRDWFRRKPQRAGGPPIDIVPETGRHFGPGAGHQPDHAVLLRESLGLADAATRAIANRLASLELQVTTQRRVSDGTAETEILDDHPLKMLLDRPHPNISLFQLMRLTGQWIVTLGEAYWRKVGNGFGLPVEIHPVLPSMVEPQVSRGVVESYLVTDANGKQFPVPADTMIRFYFPDPENPWRSEGYLGPSAITLDAHKFASEHLRSHYQHDATPKIVLESDAEATLPSPDERRRFWNEWMQAYHGRLKGEQGGTPRILTPGWKAHQLDPGAGESTKAYLEIWRDELLMEFGVPRSLLGQVVSGDRSSAETNLWAFDLHTMTPIANLVADALTYQLANEFEGDVSVGFAPFVSADKEFELRRELQDLEHGVRTINRVLTDREDDEVPWGDEPLMLSKVAKYDPNAKPVAPVAGAPEPPDDDDDAPEDEERALHIGIRKLARKKSAA